MMHALIFRSLGLISLVLLPVSAMLPWYRVPVGFSTRADGVLECQSPTPHAVPPFAVACIAAAVAMAWGWYRGRARSEWTAKGLSALLVIILFFPYCLTILDPSLAAQSAWLVQQHENLTAFNGDYSVDQEFGPLAWRRYIYGTPDDVWRVPVIHAFEWGSDIFQLGHMQTLVRSLGYTDPFCQFFGPGWVVALMAAGGLLVAAWSENGIIQPKRVIISARFALGFGFACTFMALAPVVIVAYLFSASHEAAARGEYESSAMYLRGAAIALPILDEESSFTMQCGLLDWRLGRMDSLHAQLFEARTYEKQGQDAVAEQTYRSIVKSVQSGTSLHHEACDGLLRIGIGKFNSGLLDSATELFETTLAQEPCNLKANFALQLAYLRTSKRDELEQLVKRIDLIYTRYQYPTKALIVAFSHENAKLAAYLAGDLEDSIRHDFRAKHPEVSSKSYRIKHP